MKTVRNNIFGVMVIVAALTACNSDLEKRVSTLERKVVEMENKAVTSSHDAHSELVNTAQVADQPEEKPEGPLPSFKFSETVHDFGQIKEGDVVTHTFNFTNTGEAPLIIQDAKASCGCTVPSYPKEPIPAGGSGEIVVKFDSSNKPGVQNKTVTITANTYPSTNKLNIKSVVVGDNTAADAATN